MEYNETTDQIKRRFRANCYCPICGYIINTTQSFQYLKYKTRKEMSYVFFHSSCLESARKAIAKIRV